MDTCLKIQSHIDMKIACSPRGETHVCLARFPFYECHKSHKWGQLATSPHAKTNVFPHRSSTVGVFEILDLSHAILDLVSDLRLNSFWSKPRNLLLRFFLGPPGLVILQNFGGMPLFSFDVVLFWIFLSPTKASFASTGEFFQGLQQGRHPLGRGFGRDSEP